MQALRDVKCIIERNNRKLEEFAGMPVVPQDSQEGEQEDHTFEITDELCYDPLEQESLLQQRLHSFNLEQQAAYEAITRAYASHEDAKFFVDGGAGCGKTFPIARCCLSRGPRETLL